MLTYHRTSILTSQAQTVVNTVNTVGVMGKGLASAFKARYPDMFKAYRELCKEKHLDIGQLWLWKGQNQWVLSFPTKRHWRNPSKLTYIEAGLKKFIAQYEQRGIREIAFPRLGCGNGGLNWDDVRPLMERYLSPLPIPVYIHDFEVDIGLPEHHESQEAEQFQRSFKTFLNHLGSVIYREHGQFYTVSNSSPYQASFDEAKNLLIKRHGRRSLVPNDELYELWTLLLRGPLTRRRLPGAARDSAYYLFPILARLPYVRPIEVGRKDDIAAMAVELLDQGVSTQILAEANDRPDQGELEWV
jgi:O-acetyl-ADP-ribose deacetylase (regulator of RNase III)